MLAEILGKTAEGGTAMLIATHDADFIAALQQNCMKTNIYCM